MTYAKIVSTIALTVLLAVGSWAKDRGKGNSKPKGDQTGQSRTAVTATVDIFVGSDQEVIREYVSTYEGSGLPPGLSKRCSFPPGLEKQLRRKGKLPPGLQKKLVAFPPTLEQRLSVLKTGLKRGFIEGRAVIYNPKTSIILDVFVPL